MPGKQDLDYFGLQLEATPAGARGLYFTDELLEVTFGLRNLTGKRIKGEVRVFCGCGPSGLESKTAELLCFDLEPKGQLRDHDTQQALRRLVALQGNGIIALALPPPGCEAEAIHHDNETETALQASPADTGRFHTLYTFATMEREFHDRFYAGAETTAQEMKKLRAKTNELATYIMVLTVITITMTVISIGLALAGVFGWLPPAEVQVVP